MKTEDRERLLAWTAWYNMSIGVIKLSRQSPNIAKPLEDGLEKARRDLEVLYGPPPTKEEVEAVR